MILLDELSMGLAPTIVDRAVRRRARAWPPTGVTTVVVEQFAGVTAFADHVAVMAGGRIRLAGPPDEVADQLASAYLGRHAGEAGCGGCRRSSGVVLVLGSIPARDLGADAWTGVRRLRGHASGTAFTAFPTVPALLPVEVPFEATHRRSPPPPCRAAARASAGPAPSSRARSPPAPAS